MAIAAILANIPWLWRIAAGTAVLLVAGGAYGMGLKRGFDAGHATAKARGDAACAALELDYARRYADALEQHAAKFRREAERAVRASSELAKAKEEHAKTERSLQKRIAAVTRNNAHHFSPDFVRVWNEATGAGGHPGRAAFGAGRTLAATGPGSTAGSGVRGLTEAVAEGIDEKGTAPERLRVSGGMRGTAMMGAAGGAGAVSGQGDEPGKTGSGPAPNKTGVTERDVLAYIVYYGKRSRDMEAQVSSLIRFVGERE